MDDLINLQRLFSDKIFRIPDYQRGYSWGKEQLDDFWEDLTSLLPEQDHYTGMISLKKVANIRQDGDSEKWVNEQWLVKGGYEIEEIVDGQQRLTTLIILINEIVSFCDDHQISEINNTDIEKIRAKYLYEVKSGGIIRTYKFGYEADNPSYDYFRIKVLNDPAKTEVEETFYTLNLATAKEYFHNKINELADDFSKIEEIYTKVTLNLKFNLYNINDDFNVFVAFETMNNRGKRLSYLELLKNRLIYLSTLFKNEEDEKIEVREDINDTWRKIYWYLGKDKNRPLSDDEFLQHHWMVYFGYQTRKTSDGATIPFHSYLLNKFFIQQNIGSQAKREQISESDLQQDDLERELSRDEDFESDEEMAREETTVVSNKLTLKKVKDYVDSLKELIPFWYQTFTQISVDNDEIARRLGRLDTLGYVNARPLAMVILSKENISDETKIECLKLIERFNFLHYRLSNYSSTYSSTVFYNLARDLYYETIDIGEVMQTVGKIDYLSSNNVVISNGPVDKFERLMKRDGYYSWGTLKYLLYIYDLNASGDSIAKQKINPDEYFKQDPKDMCSIEHVYPQTPTDEYWVTRFGDYSENQRRCLTGSLGNLLPLSLRINKTLQNNAFGIKRLRYENGSTSEQEVANWNGDEWLPDCILARGMYILNFMETEFDFKFEDDKYRKKMLGLDFMIDEADANSNRTEPIIIEETPKPGKEREFNEETFRKLSAPAHMELLALYRVIDSYCKTLSDNVIVFTKPSYVAYREKKNFMEVHFYKNCLHLVLRDADYDDPEGKIYRVSDTYLWSMNAVLDVDPTDDIEYVKQLIKRSYEDSMNR